MDLAVRDVRGAIYDDRARRCPKVSAEPALPEAQAARTAGEGDGAMIGAADLRAIAAHYGGNLSGKECLIPTPGHSPRDRGTAIRLASGAPDGLLVACYNGGRDEALAVKDMLRRDGFLPSRGDCRPRELTGAEREAIRRAEAEREREKAEAHAKAAENARQRLAGARPADPGHPYLVRKRIAPEGLWQGRDAFGAENALLVPMRDLAGLVWNLQSIVAGRAKEKLYQPGGRTKGLFWAVGKPVDRLVIGEGVATVAAVRRASLRFKFLQPFKQTHRSGFDPQNALRLRYVRARSLRAWVNSLELQPRERAQHVASESTGPCTMPWAATAERMSA